LSSAISLIVVPCLAATLGGAGSGLVRVPK